MSSAEAYPILCKCTKNCVTLHILMFNSEIFIARRFSQGGNRSRNVMVTLAVITVAVSIAVMVLSLAVIRGFRSEITDKLSGFGGQIQVVGRYSNNSWENDPIRRDHILEQQTAALGGIRSIAPYAIKGGMITAGEGIQGVMLKGVGADYDLSFFGDYLLDGGLPRLDGEDRTKDLLISKAVADMLRLEVGDPADMLFITEQRATLRDRFRICGIFTTGLEEMDRAMAITDIRNVQRLGGWDADMITGYEIAVRDFSRIENQADQVAAIVRNRDGRGGQYLSVITIGDRYRYLFDWLATHNVNAVVIITIMIVVALINMIAALLIIILERIGEIAVLKTLGMRNSSLQKVFVWHCGSIVLRGIMWGNIVGIALCLIQKYTGIVTLNQTNYFLTQVPISLGWWVVWLNLGSLVLLTLLLAAPTLVISLIKPEKSLRFK